MLPIFHPSSAGGRCICYLFITPPPQVGAAYEVAVAHAARLLGDRSSALEIDLGAEQHRTVQALLWQP